MSDTPRTDKNKRNVLGEYWTEASFSEQLERELNEARELIKKLNNLCYTKTAQEYLDRIEKGTENE